MPTNGVVQSAMSSALVAQESFNTPVVVVQLDWRDWRRAFVPLAAIDGVHWRRVAGAPRPILHGYVPCSSVIAGTLQHTCTAADAPHRLHVCILKRHTVPSLYEAMCRRAGGC
jgi:hypothetical protein